MAAYDEPNYAGGAGGVGGGGGAIATAPPVLAPRAIAPGGYNPAVVNAKAAVDAYRGSVARRLGGVGGLAALDDALVNDQQYQKLVQNHADAQQSHVMGMALPDYQRMRAASDYLSNQAGAVTTDANSRQVQAQGQYARDAGQGAAYAGQGALSTAQAGEVTGMLPSRQAESAANTARTRALTPVEQALGISQANMNNAGAARTTAMTPAEVAQINAGANATNAGAARTTAMTPAEAALAGAQAGKTTAEANEINTSAKLMPQVLQNSQSLQAQDRAAKQQLEQSETAKNYGAAGVKLTVGPDGKVAPAPPTPVVPSLASRAVSYMADNPIKSTVAGAVLGGGSPVGALPYLIRQAVGGAPAAPSPAAAPSAPTAPVAPAAAAPQRQQLPDGRIVERVGDSVYQVMPDGSRRLLKVGA